jgi:7,8-dihydropterin-6-yl-methyl-4-(beta-D-ribofuranosyl)aminobenzene 5'-phosphate synthase
LTPAQRRLALGLLFLSTLARPSIAGDATASPLERVSALRIVVLSTMLADAGLGEWGFAALVEADGRQILFDTGAHPRTVLDNAKELGIDLSLIEEVVLSHNHEDHTGGLLVLRRELGAKNPRALHLVHVGRGIFWSRPDKDGREGNPMIEIRRQFEATGGTFVEHDAPVAVLPGLWLTGPVPRVHPERNWSVQGRVKSPEGLVEDNVPEDQSLVADTSRGLILLAGCGHAGIINTIDYARKIVRPAPLHAAIGGFHLFPATDANLDWTATKLRELGLEHFIGAHCTGIEAVYRIRERVGLTRATAVVGAVGAGFELGKGIEPGRIAR